MNPEDCTTVTELERKAKDRQFSCCKECPRYSKDKYSVFAAGCSEHQITTTPLILFITRDPSRPVNPNTIGCNADENVCAWCHTDGSANNFREKLYPILERDLSEIRKRKDGRFPVYAINAVLHGPERNTRPSTKARDSCSHILKAYVNLLNPKLVVALGCVARDSLKKTFNLPNFKDASSPIEHDGRAFWWTFHPSPRSYNRKKIDIEEGFERILEYLQNRP